MATPTRIYVVRPASKDAAAAAPRLVRATHPAHALRHVADGAYTVAVASQEDLVSAFQTGMKVEDIKQEQHELPAS